MYWGGQEASERIYINFELEPNKEYVFEVEGGSREDLHQFGVRIGYGIFTGVEGGSR